MIGALIDGAIKRRKVVLGVTVIACLFGLFAYMSMPREANPDIDLPYISVVVPFPGVSPEDAERLIIKPLEVQLQTIQGVKHLNAVAREGVAIATLEFDPSFPKQ
ncbi:MAG: efflux RND transporter permease subunit, partial [Proteobacteria bacterium]|nr:efflux RND transporter permease subunit [Pseudomonadota bacterium]